MKSKAVEGTSVGQGADEQATSTAVRNMFAIVAPRYDLLNHLLSAGVDIGWRRATVRSLQPVLSNPSSVVADLCCGTGDLALALRRASAGKVLGADFCHPMLQLARKKSVRLPRITTFLEADTLRLPFRDESLDAVTIAFGFRNLVNYRRGVQEMRRVLRVGGMVAILEFSRVTWPVFGPLFRAYFRLVLPRLGAWISGVQGPYQYLPDSVSRFPDQEALSDLLREEGFSGVRYRNFTGGVAALHLGEKG